MVFVRASTGCDECRSKHTKCDGATPACGRCQRRGIVCPGYRHTGGFVFKTQTTHEPKARRRLQLQESAVGDKAICRRNFASRDPDRFVAFFFDTYVFAGRQNDSSCGLFDHAAAFCRRGMPSSTLMQAVSVLGVTTFILSHHLNELNVSWYYNIRLNAIRSMHRDIKSKTSQMRDDTLLAVLLLDLTEVIIRAHMGSTARLSHQHGALALLKLRSTRNFETAEARSLYNAARYATLRDTTRSADTISALRALSLLAEAEVIDQPPALQLLDTLDNISALQVAVEAAASRGQSFDHLHSWALETQISLDAWAACLPSSWVPRTIAAQLSAGSAAWSLVERYESMDMAVVYNHWRCACLKMLRLRQVLSPVVLSGPQPPVDEVTWILEGIRRAIPVFLGFLHGSGYVSEDAATQAWREVPRRQNEVRRQRFSGDYLGKWFLSDLLKRLEQAVGDPTDILPALHLSTEQLLFLREQRQIVSDLAPSAMPQLVTLFSTV